MIERIKKWVHRWMLRRAIKRVRRTFAELGHPLNSISDDVIIETVEVMTESMKLLKTTVTQTTETFQKLEKELLSYDELLDDENE